MTPKPTHHPFDPAQFDRQIALDNTVRSLMIAAGVLAAVAAVALPGVRLVSGLIGPGLIIGLWLWWSASTARAGRALTEVGALMASDPARAERLLEDALSRRPVMRWARLLAYHRLAGIWHHERRYHDSAALCLCLLNQPLKGPAAQARPHLLLMLAEAQLQRGNTHGAYHALAHLQQLRLGLNEALQRLAIQTRYEVGIGADAKALHRAHAKIELAELMPAPQGAAVHAMLATAAARHGDDALADRLWQRTRLLTPKPLLNQFERGVFSVGIVAHEQAPA